MSSFATDSKLLHLDHIVTELLHKPADGRYPLLSHGERLYVALAAQRLDLLAAERHTIASALSRIGADGVAALTHRWKDYFFKPTHHEGSTH